MENCSMDGGHEGIYAGEREKVLFPSVLGKAVGGSGLKMFKTRLGGSLHMMVKKETRVLEKKPQ